MGFLNNTSTGRIAHTLRVAAHLLSYPDDTLRQHLPELRDALHAENALSPSRLGELDTLIESLARSDALDCEAAYVELFDRGRRTSLHLFEHVHGDSRDRGPAMIDLAQTYEKGGLYLAEGEMPDYLPVVLEFASTQPTREAAGFLGEIAHLINAIFNALEKRETRYASVMGALLDLAGESARPVQLPDEASIDEAWEEPAAFDGCHSSGQERPGEAKPVHIVRRPAGSDPQRSGASA